VLSGIITFLNPNIREAAHLAAANAFDRLNNEARVFWSVDCWLEKSEVVLTAKPRDLIERKADLNAKSPQIPSWAYKKAKAGIPAVCDFCAGWSMCIGRLVNVYRSLGRRQARRARCWLARVGAGPAYASRPHAGRAGGSRPGQRGPRTPRGILSAGGSGSKISQRYRCLWGSRRHALVPNGDNRW
jgi:hypothetical protein